jgi:hypothetical protein
MRRPLRLGSELGALLERVAANQGLEPGIHPGYPLQSP